MIPASSGDLYYESDSIYSLLRSKTALTIIIFLINADYEREEPVIVVARGKALHLFTALEEKTDDNLEVLSCKYSVRFS